MRLRLAFIYSSTAFISLYVLISVSLRILKVFENYYSHVAAGIIATIISLIIFVLYLIKNKKVPK
jgi:hypothetical protein